MWGMWILTCRIPFFASGTWNIISLVRRTAALPLCSWSSKLSSSDSLSSSELDFLQYIQCITMHSTFRLESRFRRTRSWDYKNSSWIRWGICWWRPLNVRLPNGSSLRQKIRNEGKLIWTDHHRQVRRIFKPHDEFSESLRWFCFEIHLFRFRFCLLWSFDLDSFLPSFIFFLSFLCLEDLLAPTLQIPDWLV